MWATKPWRQAEAARRARVCAVAYLLVRGKAYTGRIVVSAEQEHGDHADAD